MKTVKLKLQLKFVKIWENGQVRFTDEKPVFGEIRDGNFDKWLEIIPQSVKNGDDRITIVKSTEPKKMKCGSLLEPQIITGYKSKFNCLKAFVRANQDMAKRVQDEMNKGK